MRGLSVSAWKLLEIVQRDQAAVCFRERGHALGDGALIKQVADCLQLGGSLSVSLLFGLGQFPQRLRQNGFTENFASVGRNASG